MIDVGLEGIECSSIQNRIVPIQYSQICKYDVIFGINTKSHRFIARYWT